MNPDSVFEGLSELNMYETLPKKVSGDPDRLIQVAINIIGNAIDNTFHDG